MPAARRHDNLNRSRAVRFRQSIAYYLMGAGLPVRLREQSTPEPVRLSEAILRDEVPSSEDKGHIEGLAQWALFCRADYAHDSSGALNDAQRGKGGRRWAAVIQFRRSPALAGDQMVLMTLADFVEVVRVTEGIEA